MDEVKRIYYDDIREKKSIKNSASKTNRVGRGPIRFPSDYLSKKERESMNGPVVSVDLNRFYTWQEFKGWSSTMQVRWLNAIMERYNVGIGVMNGTVFHNGHNVLNQYISQHGLRDQLRPGKYNQRQVPASMVEDMLKQLDKVPMPITTAEKTGGSGSYLRGEISIKEIIELSSERKVDVTIHIKPDDVEIRLSPI